MHFSVSTARSNMEEKGVDVQYVFFTFALDKARG
jgi:hypothetical protein